MFRYRQPKPVPGSSASLRPGGLPLGVCCDLALQVSASRLQQYYLFRAANLGCVGIVTPPPVVLDVYFYILEHLCRRYLFEPCYLLPGRFHYAGGIADPGVAD